MSDITTTDQDPYARFFAMGGTITRRDVRVENGRVVSRMMKINGRGEVVASEEVRDDPTQSPLKPRKTHDTKGRPVNEWHNIYSGGPVRTYTPESRRRARELARAIEAAKEARNSGAKPAGPTGMEKMQANRGRRTKARLAKTLRMIGDEWTGERIDTVARDLGVKTRTLRVWLRSHGFGDKLPEQRRVLNLANLRNFKPARNEDAGEATS